MTFGIGDMRQATCLGFKFGGKGDFQDFGVRLAVYGTILEEAMT
jgi:hypothetical protein